MGILLSLLFLGQGSDSATRLISQAMADEQAMVDEHAMADKHAMVDEPSEGLPAANIEASNTENGASELKGRYGPVVTFLAFRVHEDKSATFRVDIDEKATVERSQEGKKIVFLIRGATIEKKNNKNPLHAQYFGTNVVTAKLDEQKKGVSLTVELLQEVTTNHRIREHQAGATLIVDIPPPKAESSSPDKAAPKSPSGE